MVSPSISNRLAFPFLCFISLFSLFPASKTVQSVKPSIVRVPPAYHISSFLPSPKFRHSPSILSVSPLSNSFSMSAKLGEFPYMYLLSFLLSASQESGSLSCSSCRTSCSFFRCRFRPTSRRLHFSCRASWRKLIGLVLISFSHFQPSLSPLSISSYRTVLFQPSQ